MTAARFRGRAATGVRAGQRDRHSRDPQLADYPKAAVEILSPGDIMRLRAAEHATEIAEGCQMRRGGRRQPRVPITVYGCCIIQVMNEHWLPDWRSYDNRSDRACYEGVRTRKLLFFDALHLRRHQGLASRMRQPNRKPATRYCAPSSGGRAGAASGTGACGAVAADSSAPVESKSKLMTDRRNPTATGDTFVLLRDRITRLQYRPGELPMVEHLAAQRGVSRTPVREALVRLAELDLVQPTDGRKFQVAPLSLQDVDELFEFREALEPLAATASSDADLETLQAIVDQMRANLAAGDVDAFYGERPVSKTTQDLDQRSGRWQASRWAILDHLQKTHGQLKTYLTNWRRIQAAAGRRGGTLSSFEAAGTEIGAGPRDGTLHAYA